MLLPLRPIAWLAVAVITVSACRSPAETVSLAEGAPGSRLGSTAGHLSLKPGPPNGDLPLAVREAMSAAAAERRRLVVYVGAVWCEPCQRFHDAATRGDLDSILGDVTLFEFDLDRDGRRLAAAGYTSAYIPLFALPSADGKASGEQVEGGIKGDRAVQFVVDGLLRLLGH